MDKKIIDKIMTYNFVDSDISIQELKLELTNELKKPIEEQDFDLIDEINLYIIQLSGKSEDVKIDFDKKLDDIMYYSSPKRRHIHKFSRYAIAACAVLTVFVSSNIFTLSAFGMNIFSTIVEFGKGTINFDFNQQEKGKIIDLPTSADDPYGIKSECQKNGMSPLLPSFIPEGYKLVNIETSNIDSFSKGINFLYKNGNKSINISVDEYEKEVPADFGFPNEDGSLQELQINELTTFVLNEGERYSAAFSKDLILYGMHTKNVDYDTLLKILESFK